MAKTYADYMLWWADRAGQYSAAQQSPVRPVPDAGTSIQLATAALDTKQHTDLVNDIVAHRDAETEQEEQKGFWSKAFETVFGPIMGTGEQPDVSDEELAEITEATVRNLEESGIDIDDQGNETVQGAIKWLDDYIFQPTLQGIATPLIAGQMSSEADPDDPLGEPDVLLEGETWAKAWERAEYTHFGRALAESLIMSPEERREFHADGFDEFGNPVNEAYAEIRRSDPAYNLISGPVDFLTIWYAAPDVLVTRAATRARAVHKGDLPRLRRRNAERVRHIATTPEQHLADLKKKTPHWDRVGRRAIALREQTLALRNRLRAGEIDTFDLTQMQAFSQSPQGTTAAHLFSEAAQARRIDDVTGQVTDVFDDDLFDMTVAAMLGHGGAVRRLENRFDEIGDAVRAMADTKQRWADEVTRWGEEIQRIKQRTMVPEHMRRMALAGPQHRLDKAVQMEELAEQGLRQYQGYEDFIARAFDEGPGLSMVPRDARSFGQVAGNLRGVSIKTFRPTGHANVASQVITVPRMAWLKRPGIASLHNAEESFEAGTRLMDQVAYYTKGRGLNELAQRNGANSWEELKRKFADRLAASTTDTERLALLTRIENLSIAGLANRYGMSAKEAKNLADHVRGLRQNLIRSAEQQAQKSYSQAKVDGKRIDTFRHVNMDGTEEVIQLPIDVTQLRQTFIATDLRAMDALLKNHSDSIRAVLWGAPSDAATNALEVFNHYWKPSVLLRAGYPVRNVIDDGARALAANMSFSFMLRGGQSLARGGLNIPDRVMNRVTRVRNWMTFREDAITRPPVPPQALRESVGPIDAVNEARRNTILKRARVMDTWMQRSARADVKGTPAPQTPSIARKLNESLDNLGQERVLVVDGPEGRVRAMGAELVEAQKWETAFDASLAVSDDISARTLHNYIRDHADWLSNKGNAVMLRLRDDGRVELSVARRNLLEDLPHRVPERELRKSGTAPVRVKGYDFSGSMADEGDMMRAANSSDQFNRNLYRSQELNLQNLRADNMRRTVQIGEPDFEASWVLAVNDQIRHSPIWRRMLDGWSDEELVRWLNGETVRGTSGAAGRRIAKRMAFKAHNPVAWMDEMRAHLNHYLPDDRLRAIVRQRDLSIEDVSNLDKWAARPVTVDGPALKQAAGTHRISQGVNKMLDNVMHWIATVPTDILVRNPFFDQNYKFSLSRFVDTLEEGAQITPKMRQLAERQARQYALKQTKRYMFSLADQSEMTHTLRFISPFIGAWAESLIRWGRIVMERPEAFARLYVQGWELGIDKIWGVEESINPYTGEEQIEVPMPEWSKTALAAILPNVGREDLEGFEQFAIPKQSLNVTLQGSPWWLPGGGPLVQAPAAFFLRNSPEMADENALKRFAWNWLFPAGRPRSAFDAIAPSWVQQFERYHAGGEDPVYNNLFLLIYKNDYQRLRESGIKPQEIDKDELMRESWDKAKGVQFFYTAGRLGSPFAFQLIPESQMWIDMARQYRETYGDREGLQRFADEMGEDAYLWWTSLSKSNLVVPPTSPGFKKYKQFREDIEKYPELAPVIVGMDAYDAEFNPEVYGRQQEIPVGPGDPRKQRAQKTAPEFIAETEALQGWQEYRQWRAKIEAELAARGKTNIQQTGAEDLVWANLVFVDDLKEKLPGWGREYEQFDTGRGYAYVDTVRKFIESGSANLERPDLAGLAEYVQLHDKFAAELDARKSMGGSRSIEAKSNLDLALAWQDAIGGLVQRNPAFSEIYYRYLERHTLRNGSN